MAPVSQTLTPRLFVTYSDGSYDHTLSLRAAADDGGAADVMAVVDDYLTQLAPKLYLITITQSEVAAIGSNVRNPVTWTGQATYGSGAMPAVNAPRYIEFTGKQGNGRRWHMVQFGLNIATPPTYEFLPTDDADLDAARAVLIDAFAVSQIVGVTGLKVTLNSEVPLGFNDHFIVRARG